MHLSRSCGGVIIGGGPAGLAPLVWAARKGFLKPLAQAGLIVVERAAALGAGSIGSHAIGSDTLADTFLECLEDSREERLLTLRHHPAAEALRAYTGGAAPLALVADFLTALGTAMHAAIEAAGGRVLLEHEAVFARKCPDGRWMTMLRSRKGKEIVLTSNSILLATGGRQWREDLFTTPVGDSCLLPAFDGKLMLSGEVLGTGGVAEVTRRLAGLRAPRVAIVGGSHSAVAVANLLLYRMPGVHFEPGAVSILHRRPLRIFYPSADAACAEGYTDFGADDICPLTGRVFRLAGFRLDARELVMRALGIGGRPPEPRLQLQRIAAAGDNRSSQQLLEAADLVIPALGYRPRALNVLQPNGEELTLAASGPGAAPLVDANCRVLDAAGQPVSGLFGIGLAAGFVPQGATGGEPSFVGQTNGLWLWQNPVGAMVVEAFLGRGSDRVAA